MSTTLARDLSPLTSNPTRAFSSIVSTTSRRTTTFTSSSATTLARPSPSTRGTSRTALLRTSPAICPNGSAGSRRPRTPASAGSAISGSSISGPSRRPTSLSASESPSRTPTAPRSLRSTRPWLMARSSKR
eukprot:Amastigsp_a677584_398.p3 type:complete len:131 gc:universal Amastigsp_a677584_398:165-557(+)